MKRIDRMIGMTRPKYLKALLVTLAAAGLCADADAMIYRPEKGGMWDPSILWYDGKYHAFTMYRKEGEPSHGHCFYSSSEDGVHWKEEGVVLEERERAKSFVFFKCMVARCGDRFIMNHGVALPRSQDILRFYESTDLRNWSYLFSNQPDPRWYGVAGELNRWDHMYMLPKEEGNLKAGYWGFPVSAPKPFDRGGVGRMQSADGRTWEVLPPAEFEWPEGLPHANHFEWGGCERIDGKYYLIGGGGYLGNRGYGMYTFVADRPEGPFRPDLPTVRLCGNSGGNVTWLATWCRGKEGELLISNYASWARGDDAQPWLLPLRKPIIDRDGHLRLAWWPGNERLKGDALPLKEKALSLPGKDGPAAYETAWLDTAFDLQTGVILEGTLRGTTAGGQPAAGLVFDEGNDQSMAVLLELALPEGRQTHIGRLATHPGDSQFDSEDVTGKYSATVTGLDPGREHQFRLLMRLSLFELYVDDRLMQTYAYRPASGRLGFVARNARLDVRDLKAWRMSLPAEKSFALSRPRAVTVRNKTLVAWVAPATLDQAGGSALTLEGPNDLFDGMVFGECAPRRWMAGSDGLRRTCADQSGWPQETADARTFVQIAVVYRGRQVTLYRNGTIYADYTMPGAPAAFGPDDTVLIGRRHLHAGASASFAGAVEDARIYDRALTAEQVASLKPDQPSDPKPWAWWTFEKGKETDLTGRFPVHVLSGGAKIEHGRLVLESEGATLIAVPRRKPAYHVFYQGASGGPFDPNAALYWNGRYHLHYIVMEEGGASYAHVSSTDMVHWVEHPLTLTHQKMGKWLASGTCIVNKEGTPTIIFHGCDPKFCRHNEGIGQNCLGFARDANLENWEASPFPVEPTLKPGQNPHPIARWDPDLWLEGNTYYALFGFHPGAERNGKKPTLMRSSDLETWEYVGEFFHREMAEVARDEDLSCPNFFKLGDKHMLLCISHNKGCRYYLGEWKNEKFTPDFHARMNWSGADVFAPESLLTPDGRRVMWAWCIGGGYRWNGIQSLPRELSLPKDGILRIKPLRELEQLRYNPSREENLVVASGMPCPLKGVVGDTIELMATIKQGEARRYGVRVLCDRENGKGMDVVVEPESKSIKLGATTAPLELKAGEDIQLRIFVDRGIVEVFANDRQAVLKQHAYAQDDVGVCFFSEGGRMELKEVKSWKMKSIYAGR